MKLGEIDYKLPKNLIAQKPTRPRDWSQLMIIGDDKSVRHCRFYEIDEFLKNGDVLVLNDSKVIPARLFAKKSTGGKTEILLLRQIDPQKWKAVLGNYRLKESGKPLFVSGNFRADVIKNIRDNIWEIKFNVGGQKLKDLILKFGNPPTPPYIKSRVKTADYQTVYAKKEGSVAAPTAGFHFSKKLIGRLKKKGIRLAKVTLHVELGTFEPIKENVVENHKMHSELAILDAKTAGQLNKAKKEGKRVIAAGTTSARLLESFSDKNGGIVPGKKETDIFITPGYKFKNVDGLITNFHLPKSTNILLTAAFLQFKNPKINGIKKIKDLYGLAIKKRYHFYSFGDAMLII